MIRLYEHRTASFRTVSEGMERAIRENGKLAGVCRDDDDGFKPVDGVDAPYGLVVGAPHRCFRPHLRGDHQKVWWLAAPNSEGVPPQAVTSLMDGVFSFRTNAMRPMIDGIFATSHWAKDVLVKSFPSLPVLVWQHGVLPDFFVQEEQRESVSQRYDSNEFQLLHVTSTVSRKGTFELLLAWRRFTQQFPTLRCRLDLLVNPQHLMEFSDCVSSLRLASVLVAPGQSYETRQLRVGMSAYHGVVQPSRAEGFGLVPLEARACGIPVLMTACTGHADHVEGPGVVVVPHRDSAKSDDFPGATAPTVDAEDIYAALLTFYNDWKRWDREARDHAPTLQKEWAWENRAVSAIRELENLNV